MTQEILMRSLARYLVPGTTIVVPNRPPTSSFMDIETEARSLPEARRSESASSSSMAVDTESVINKEENPKPAGGKACP